MTIERPQSTRREACRLGAIAIAVGVSIAADPVAAQDLVAGLDLDRVDKLTRVIGNLGWGFTALFGAWWAVEKLRRRDEHFPRVNFEVGANFIGEQDGKVLAEVVAVIENKGIVPFKMKNLTFTLRGLSDRDAVLPRQDSERSEINFPHKLASGSLVPSDWPFSFVYPGVRTEYNFVTTVPPEMAFIRVQGRFLYLTGRPGETHHAARTLAVSPSRVPAA